MNNCGGESGIRTHDRVSYTRVPGVRLKPLGHLSYKILNFICYYIYEILLKNKIKI